MDWAEQKYIEVDSEKQGIAEKSDGQCGGTHACKSTERERERFSYRIAKRSIDATEPFTQLFADGNIQNARASGTPRGRVACSTANTFLVLIRFDSCYRYFCVYVLCHFSCCYYYKSFLDHRLIKFA